MSLVLIFAIPLVVFISAFTLAMPTVLAASATGNRANRKARTDEADVCSSDTSSAVESPTEEHKSGDI